MKRYTFRVKRFVSNVSVFLLLSFCLALAVGCIRVSSDPIETQLLETPATALSESSEPVSPEGTTAASSTEPEVTLPQASATADLVVPLAPPAGRSSLPPIGAAVRWGYDAQSDIHALELVSLDGGPLLDIVAASGEDTVFTLGLNQEEYWRKRFSGPVATVSVADLNGNGVGEVLISDSSGVTVMERGEILWRYDYTASINLMAAVDPGRYLGASLLAAGADGMLLALDGEGELLWGSPLSGESDLITQLVTARLELNAAYAIIAGSASGRLSSLDNGGRAMWQVELGSSIRRVVAVDLDSDGNLEIVAATDDGLTVVGHSGEVTARWLISDSITQVIAADVDGDDKMELVASSDSVPGTLTMLDEGVIRWQILAGSSEIDYLTSGDLDGDGIREILVGSEEGHLIILDGNGQIRSQFNVGAAVNEILLADLDSVPNSPQPELVVSAGPFIYLLDIQEAAAEQPESRPPPAPSPPAAVDGASVPNGNDLPRYVMEVSLDSITYQARVVQAVTVTNDSRDSWDELIFNVSTAYWPGTFTLHSAKATSPGQSALDDIETTLENTMLAVQLDTLAPGESATVQFDYTLNLPKLDPVGWGPTGNAGWGPELVQMGDWYPALVPYASGSGWKTWQFVPVGDPVTSRLADYEVTIHADPRVQVAAAGRLSQADGQHQFRLAAARAFGFTASPVYVRTEGSANGIPVQLFLTNKDQQHAQIVLQTAVDAISLFTELYGPYPYQELVIAENGFLTSNEYSGFISLGGYLFDVYDGSPDSLLVAITAHEVAHQWWYGAVGNDQVLEPWLDEGLAMMSELLFYEQKYPSFAGEWWNFRVDRWNPSGFAGSTIYEFNDSASFVHNVYGQSAHFLQRLRLSMGDEAFGEFLRDYYLRYRDNIATGDDFFELAQTYSLIDLTSLRSLYFE